MFFFLPIAMVFVTFLVSRGLLRWNSSDAIGISSFVGAISSLFFMLFIPAIATESSSVWHTKSTQVITSEIRVTEIGGDKQYAFWAGDESVVLDDSINDIEFIPPKDDEDILANDDTYTILCDDTPNILAPFNFGGCVHRLALTNPLED